MISYAEALQLLRSVALTLGEETVDSSTALGRTLAQDIVSLEQLPSFANSAMDGYAVRSSDTKDATPSNPVTLQVAKSLAAGDFSSESFAERACVEIMTGAPVPSAFDAVIKVEEVLGNFSRRDQGISTPLISVTRRVPANENVRPAGEDFQKGQKVLDAGTQLYPRHLMALLALGVQRVLVKRRPRVGVLSTGKEIVKHSTPSLKAGEVRNSSAPYIMERLRECGADPVYGGHVGDEKANFIDCARTLFKENIDLFLSTGAVSAGKHDFVADALEELGATTLFHKVAIRPGKPILAATLGSSKPIFFMGFPGNPISTVVGMRFFLEPFLDHLFLRTPETFLSAKLSHKIKKPEGLRCFLKARLENSNLGDLSVNVLDGQGSSLIRPLLEADYWAILPEEDKEISAETIISVARLDGRQP